MAARQEFFNLELKNFLPHPDSCPEKLLEAMKYSLYAGGKRLRPILLFAAAEVCGGKLDAALPHAVALEMVHTYSLIHDDLPAMDDDDLRRGKPSSHKVFGEATAILAGDALLTHAFSVAAKGVHEDPQRRLAAVAELAKAAGPVGMVAGQAMDIEQGKKDASSVNDIHRCKTGALIKAAVRIGAIISGAGARVIHGLTQYADSLGLAYQIADDILDTTATIDQLGKNPGSDERKGKDTFVTVHGIEGARIMLAAETSRAIKALSNQEGDYTLLEELAQYLGSRGE
mgnify:CR=1 FL=1|jgi:geranylgeranyl diphosphate synthase type II